MTAARLELPHSKAVCDECVGVNVFVCARVCVYR